MDPITAIGLLASLANLIHASNSLLKIAKSLKDGDRELLELYNDVSVFEEALKGFDRVLRSRQTKHNISATVISRALEEASTTIKDLESKLVSMSKSEVSAVRRMKWVQHKSSLNKLHERMKEQSTMLQSFLSLAHAYVNFSLKLVTTQLTRCSERLSLMPATNIPSSYKFDHFRQMIQTAMLSLHHRSLQRSRLRHHRFRFGERLWTPLLPLLEARDRRVPRTKQGQDQ